MICPKCHVQTTQFKDKGGGLALDDFYMTWTVQLCSECGQLFMEFYAVKYIDDPGATPNFSVHAETPDEL